jgi:hypothetical protein
MNDLKNMEQLPKGEARRYGGELDKMFSLVLFVLSRYTHTEDIPFHRQDFHRSAI